MLLPFEVKAFSQQLLMASNAHCYKRSSASKKSEWFNSTNHSVTINYLILGTLGSDDLFFIRNTYRDAHTGPLINALENTCSFFR